MSKPESDERLFTEDELEQAIDRAVAKTSERYERKIDVFQSKIDKLIAHIHSLYMYIEKKEMPRKQGRPPKIILSNFWNNGKKRKKKSGHPGHYTREEMIESIERLERLKARLAEEKGLKTIGDKKAIEHYVDKFEPLAADNPHLSQQKKREEVDAWWKQIKYFREQTDIRTKRYKKRKTSQ